tara:strand:+ start:154 stop:903 length:750 start_codon:yes stop_codon:yes gene_type:complete
MVVAEILTGIALVQKSVDFIKSNISTANDIKDIAKQIDGFFLGEEQMNKTQGKGMSIAEQFGSVESSASDFIDRKLLEEKRNELKQLINLRFGPTAWDQIIAERSAKINQAKEAQKLQRIEARQKQKEIIDTIQTMGIVFCVVAVVIISFVITFKAMADGYKYKSKKYTRQQKIQQGEIVLPTMTTCRLKKQKVYKGKMACIYQGANKTYELEFTDIHIGCPKKYKCVHNPGEEPSIDKVMESLRSITK